MMYSIPTVSVLKMLYLRFEEKGFAFVDCGKPFFSQVTEVVIDEEVSVC
jgi:hypothetical protein